MHQRSACNMRTVDLTPDFVLPPLLARSTPALFVQVLRRITEEPELGHQERPLWTTILPHLRDQDSARKILRMSGEDLRFTHCMLREGLIRNSIFLNESWRCAYDGGTFDLIHVPSGSPTNTTQTDVKIRIHDRAVKWEGETTEKISSLEDQMCRLAS